MARRRWPIGLRGLLGLCGLGLLAATAAGADQFDQIRARWEQQSGNVRENWQQHELEEWNSRAKSIRSRWGDEVQSTAKTYVGYAEGDQARIRVDYETGNVEIETLFDDGKRPTAEELRGRIQQTLRDAFGASASQPAALSAEYFGEPLEPTALSERMSETASVKGGDGTRHSVYKVSLKMVPDYINRLASKVLPTVREWAGKTGVDPTLVLAVIRAESAFNPRARSGIPAFGLMQIVPGFAGSEVMSQVNGRKTVPTSDFLYDPANNIMVGTKYLGMLQDKYFPDIRDTAKRTYVMICSYNWGPNRLRAAIDKRRLDVGAPAGQVFDRLEELAPAETKAYLKKVSEYQAGFREL